MWDAGMALRPRRAIPARCEETEALLTWPVAWSPWPRAADGAGGDGVEPARTFVAFCRRAVPLPLKLEETRGMVSMPC